MASLPPRKSRNKPNNANKLQLDQTAVAFYEYLHDNEEALKQASDRDGVHTVFQEQFYPKYYSMNIKNQQENDQEIDENDTPKTTKKEIKAAQRMEGLVMARLRQKKFVRTKRVGNQVLVLYADPTTSAFAPLPERASAVQDIRQRQVLLQQSKHGVEISQQQQTSAVQLVQIGETRIVTLEVQYQQQQIDPGDELALGVAALAIKDRNEHDGVTENGDKGTKVLLEKIFLAGSQRKDYSYQLRGAAAAPTTTTLEGCPLDLEDLLLTLKLDESSETQQQQQQVVVLPARLDGQQPDTLQIQLSITPNRIGIFRVHVQCHFSVNKKEFTIVRYVTIKSSGGDPVLDQILRPVTPYKRPQRRRRGKTKTQFNPESFEPPPPSEQQQRGQNPFEKLSHHNIPPEVRELIEGGELETLLERPTTSADYGSFWKHLLWASEHQAYQDMQLYDMIQVRLQREGRFLVLTVPGLAEGRPSVLRGDVVNVDWKGNMYKGKVQHTRLLEVVLEFHASLHKSYNPAVDLVDVSFTFSRMAFRTSHEACVTAETAMMDTMLFPKDVDVETIRSEKWLRKVPTVWSWANRSLNQEQMMAARNIVEGALRPLPYIIFGPPGTGKTTTVVEAVYQLARQEDDLRILLVAPSNDAADVLVERLASYFPPSELRRILAYSRSVETVPTAIRTYVAENSSDEVKLQEILRARIVVSTVALAARFSWFGVPRGHFDVLCVDEAGHATEPEVVGAAAGLLDFVRRDGRVGQMILAGDHQQLGPIVTSDICRKFGLSVSFMERLTTQDVYARQNGMYPSDLLTKLVRNYRSHPAVIKLPNEMFYDNDLECCGDQMTTHSLANWEYLKNKGFPVLFHSMNGENLREGNSPSWFNPQEAQQVVQYVKLLMHETRPPLKSDEIGIITPYRRQAQKIRLALETQDIKDVKDIKVGSVESFQGQERRCIILSTVRAETEHISSDVRYNLGFVANEKRFNVAITRAKALLIVVGSPTVLATDKDNWLEFLLYCRDNKSWLGEEWDPEEAQEDSSELKGAVHEDEWELTEPGPSQAAEQEAFAFISREE